jgi:ribosome-binding protein aMBF1 (putative translation factor)
MKRMKRNFNQIVKAKKLGNFFEEDLKKRLKDPRFRKVWEEPTGDVYLDTAFEVIKARREKRLSQRELAEKVGTSQQAIARLESPSYKGRNLSTLERVARALDKKLEVRFVS